MNSILITGCNRGLGLGLVKALVKLPKPPQHLFATCRNKDQAKVRKIIIHQNFLLNLHVVCLCAKTHMNEYFLFTYLWVPFLVFVFYFVVVIDEFLVAPKL